MNDLFQCKATCWNTRLRNCLNEKGHTQVGLIEKINKRYNTKYGQKDVSRWLNVGAKTKNGEIGFPKFTTILLIADFFNVDVGYLTGETDADTFTLEKACFYTGLDGEAMKAIRKVTDPENKSSHMVADMRTTFNKFLTGTGFNNFFSALNSLFLRCAINPYRKTEFEDLDSAIDYNYNAQGAWKFARYELSEALTILINKNFPMPSSVIDAEIKVKD